MDFFSGFKKVTHGIAVVAGLGVAWAVSDKGQEVIGAAVHAYPKLSGVAALIALLSTIYHNPKA